MDKVAVIGPGALGCLFAARLTQAGIKTYLVDHKEKRASQLSRQGITVETDEGETMVQRPTVVTKIPAGVDLVIVLIKAYSMPTLRLPTDAPVLTLQNGLGNVETIAAIMGNARVLAGTTSEAAVWLAPGHVRHSAVGRTVFGSWTTCPTQTALSMLRQAGFTVDVTDKPGQILWEKVILNAGINPLTALLNVPNGALLDIRETRELMRDLVVEAVKVAGTEGYCFSHSLVEEAERLCTTTATNLSSMLQDIRNSKRTEIDAISGEILRRAQAAMLPTPRTRVVYQLVRGLESR